jgi:flagellin FlaB
MKKRHMGTVYSAVGSIRNGQSGITGLETAIVLIAFIVVAAVFAFAVLTTGLFTTERAKETTLRGVGEAQSTLAPKGGVIGTSSDDTNVDTVRFKLANATGATGVDLASSTTLFTYTDDSQSVSVPFDADAGDLDCAAACWKSEWILGTGDSIDSGEVVEITVELKNLDTGLPKSSTFKIEVIPSQGAVVPILRTTPLEIKTVMNLE